MRTMSSARFVFNHCSVTKQEKELGYWGKQQADATTFENRKVLKLQNTHKFQIRGNKCTLKIHFWDFHFHPRWNNGNQIYPFTQNNQKNNNNTDKIHEPVVFKDIQQWRTAVPDWQDKDEVSPRIAPTHHPVSRPQHQEGDPAISRWTAQVKETKLSLSVNQDS